MSVLFYLSIPLIWIKPSWISGPSKWSILFWTMTIHFLRVPLGKETRSTPLPSPLQLLLYLSIPISFNQLRFWLIFTTWKPSLIQKQISFLVLTTIRSIHYPMSLFLVIIYIVHQRMRRQSSNNGFLILFKILMSWMSLIFSPCLTYVYCGSAIFSISLRKRKMY